jgi:hypothetical protein
LEIVKENDEGFVGSGEDSEDLLDEILEPFFALLRSDRRYSRLTFEPSCLEDVLDGGKNVGKDSTFFPNRSL